MTKKKTTVKKTPAKKPAAKKRSTGKNSSKKPAAKKTTKNGKKAEAPAPQQQVMPQVPASPFGGNVDHDEKKLDAYLEAYKDRESITTGELNGIGVIMSRVGLLGAQLGKYTLHRKYANEAFTITIQK